LNHIGIGWTELIVRCKGSKFQAYEKVARLQEVMNQKDPIKSTWRRFIFTTPLQIGRVEIEIEKGRKMAYYSFPALNKFYHVPVRRT
jgi:hypothetical protein